MQDSLLNRVNSIFKFIGQFPERTHLCAFLSENFCPLGERTAVSFSELEPDGKVTCRIAHGFPNNERMLSEQSRLSSDRPGGLAFRTLEVSFFELKNVDGKFDDFGFRDLAADFKSAVLIPVGLKSLYGFALQCSQTSITGFQDYVDCVRSLLEFYEKLKQGSVTLSFTGENGEQSKELTKRQRHIVDLIKEEKTNAVIAHELAFSESTIRQETIIIYRKLGINGRKELLEIDLDQLPDGHASLLGKK